jgi:hypothetical protein
MVRAAGALDDLPDWPHGSGVDSEGVVFGQEFVEAGLVYAGGDDG